MATTAAMNITVVVIQALPDRFELLKPTVVPFSTVTTVSARRRLYIFVSFSTSFVGDCVTAGLPEFEAREKGANPI